VGHDNYPFMVFGIIVASRPLYVLVHELGHAFAALAVGKRPTVMLGNHAPLLRLEFRRIGFWIHPLMFSGSCIFDKRGLTVAQIRRVVMAGPKATVLILLAYVFVWYALDASWLGWAFLGAAVVGFVLLLDEVGKAEEHPGTGDLNDRALIDLLNQVPADFVPFPETDSH